MLQVERAPEFEYEFQEDITTNPPMDIKSSRLQLTSPIRFDEFTQLVDARSTMNRSKLTETQTWFDETP
jgi:hypothetical protein